ncbi:hypothetical protein [Halobellus inordinatus]|uniref:hypothetical protein n=1 Tax=Halobellus inordinatus TaxID=1126236 RepID=UPI00210B5F41|nr:hypothetical protein [Halobellus inordinatus]
MREDGGGRLLPGTDARSQRKRYRSGVLRGVLPSEIPVSEFTLPSLTAAVHFLPVLVVLGGVARKKIQSTADA